MRTSFSAVVLGWACIAGSAKVSFAVCEFPGAPQGMGDIRLTRVAGGLSRPIDLQATMALPGRLFVAEQAGRIVELRNGSRRVVLDIRSQVTNLASPNDERGLLGFAFHPNFSQDPRVFVNYTRNTGHSAEPTRISSFRWRGGSFDPTSEIVILNVDQPYWNHNGGGLAFGPDGYLYIGLGDGGDANDPDGHGQNLRTLLATMLRIDINNGSPYSIPPDNPRLGSGARREIFAYGLRNPWRFSFDAVTGDLWVGDVGQGTLEEVDLIVSGGNYGWNTMEGSICFPPGSNCSQTGLIPPVVEYRHSEGVSITGGYVYRGARIPSLVGTYLYADFVSGTIWGFRYEEGVVTDQRVVLTTGYRIASFGQDENGELYVVHFGGQILRVDPAPASSSTFPQTVADTGCFTGRPAVQPAAGLIRYDVNVPLWSDHAEKERFIYVPPGHAITFRADQPWTFPDRTVLIKQFRLPVENDHGRVEERLIETRFLVKKSDGFHGYSYLWDDQQQRGRLLGGAVTLPLSVDTDAGLVTQQYTIPSSSGCKRCHTQGTGEALGPSTLQSHVLEHDGRWQLQRLADAGVLRHVPTDLDHLPALSSASSAEPLAVKARSYLHAQCSSCHNPQDSAGESQIDLRALTPLGETGLCDGEPQHGDLGLPGARILVQGRPDLSLLWLRMHTETASLRMPPLGSSVRDAAGSALIRAWIETDVDCP